MDKKELQKYAHNLMFELSNEELEALEGDFDVLKAQLDLLNKVDTTNVEPMVYPFVLETTYLRPDEADHLLTQEEALANAPQVKQGHFVVPKVVK